MFNKHLYEIEKENTFSKSIRLTNEYKEKHPNVDLVSLGIGDVSFPVPKAVIAAMHDGVDDLSTMEHFAGYGNQNGIPKLREAIAKNCYEDFGITSSEIFVGDGTKTDSTSLLELFDRSSKVLVGNPTYPIYANGARALGFDVFTCDTDDEYKMLVPKEKYDIIYICSPSNPVGNSYTKEDLKKWIDYANKNNSYIIYDNVYVDFMESSSPKSIYEVEGSKTCAIELRSFSKNVSFSGTRCSYLVLPKELGEEIRSLWLERTINRFNGASYVAQKGAIASFDKKAQDEIKQNIKTYKENAKYLREELLALGFDVIGGIDSPYLFVQTPDKLKAWDAFNLFLEKMHVIVVPGSIFGSKGEDRIRISALGSKASTIAAIERMKQYYQK